MKEEAGVGMDVPSGDDEREEEEVLSRWEAVEESRSFEGTRD